MSEPDYSDPKVDEEWCSVQRTRVADYLLTENLVHGNIGEWPAWHVAPYVAVWAIESIVNRGSVGWWAISGDLPTDYISGSAVGPYQHPRNAVRAIAERWLDLVNGWKQGAEVPGFTISGEESREELAPLIESRAKLLLKWTSDDSYWEEIE